jgi:hypothetical protein
VLTKAVSQPAEVELLMMAIRGGSDGVLTASQQGTLYRRESSSERSPHFFFFTKAPMTRVTTENHIISQAKRSIVIFWTKPTFFGQSESATRIVSRAPRQTSARMAFLSLVLSTFGKQTQDQMLLCSDAFFVIFRVLFHRSGPPAIPHHTRPLAQHEPFSRPALDRSKPRCFGYLEIVHARNCLDDLAEGVQMVNGVPEMRAGLHWTFDTSNLASMKSASSSALLTVITSDFERTSLAARW